MNQASQLARRMVLVLGLALTIGLSWSTAYRSGPHSFNGKEWGSKVHRTDFTVYQAAGQAVLDGSDIYQAHNRRHWYFMYLPIFAIAMAPVALLNTFWGSLLWYLLSVLMFGHALHISVRLARRSFPDCKLEDFWLYALTVLLVLWPAMSAIARGQASVLVMYLVIVSVWFYLQERHWLAGFCLAGSIVVKAFPALFMVYFLARRKLKVVAATTACLVLLIWIAPSAVFGVRGNEALLHQWLATIAFPATTPEQAGENIRYAQMIDPRIPKNQSVQAVMIRWCGGSTRDSAIAGRQRPARRVAIIIILCLLVVSAWVCRRGRNQFNQLDAVLQLCLILMLMLFLSPVSWIQNYILLVLPLAVALSAASRETSEPLTRAFRVALALYFVASVLSLTAQSFYALGAFLWGTVIVWAVFVWHGIKTKQPEALGTFESCFTNLYDAENRL